MVRIHDLWEKKWFLLTSGDFDEGAYNTMTVAWGFFGVMWGRPVAAVVVRPTRYTYGFMEKYSTFTLCAFERRYRKDLQWLGTRSGRDSDKIAGTKLTVCASSQVKAPAFEEAELVVECRKIYRSDFHPDDFLDNSIDKNYLAQDYHRVYYGEILKIRGTAAYAFNG